MLHIRVPATSANLCVGFDTLGLCLDLYNDFYIDINSCFSYNGFEEKYCNSNNRVQVAYEFLFSKIGKTVIPISIECRASIPISRGLGSSSTLIVAGLIAADFYLGNIYSKDELYQFACELEGHPDNVGPAIFGGLVSGYKVGNVFNYIRYPVSEDLLYLMIIPDYSVSTAEARKLLPEHYKREDVVWNTSRAVNIPYAFEKGDLSLISELFVDRVHEPFRKELIKNYSKIKLISDNNSLPCCISGSGSAIMIITKDKKSKDLFNGITEMLIVLKTGKGAEYTVI